MKDILRQYPKLIYSLMLLVLLQSAGYYNFLVLPNLRMAIDNSYYSGNPLLTALLPGIAFVAGGYFADMAKDVKMGMMQSIGVLMLGGVISLLPFELARLSGQFIMHVCCGAFLALVYLHVAVLFRVANDWKDHAFLLLFLATFFGAFLSSFPAIIIMQFTDSHLTAIFPILVFLGLLLLLHKNKEVGYEVYEESDGKEPLNKSQWAILAVILLLATIAEGAISFFPHIGQGQDAAFGYQIVLYFIPFVITVGLIMFLFSRTDGGYYQHAKLIIGFSAFIGFAILEFAVENTEIFELDYLAEKLPEVVKNVLLMPVFLSIMTHVNFDNKAGLWIGLLLGVPSILITLVNEISIFANSRLIMPVIFIVLCAVAIIWLWENKTLILDTLKLDEPNQEPGDDEAESDDIIGHLVEP